MFFFWKPLLAYVTIVTGLSKKEIHICDIKIENPEIRIREITYILIPNF